MKPIELAEVKDIAEYERIRPALRARVIALKNDRRIAVGPHITFLFENRETVLAQVQEMMRAERIVHEDKIQHELDTYNRLLPDDGELSATMFVEVTDPGRIRQELERLLGITRRDCVFLEVGDGHRLVARFEPGHEEEDRLAAVQYLRFRLPAAARDLFLSGEGEVRLVIAHPNYQARATLPPNVRTSLSEDLGGGR